MKINERAKKFHNSIVFRIVAIIIALVLPINVLTIVLGNRLIEESRIQAHEENLETLKVAMGDIEYDLTKAVRKLIYYNTEKVDFIALAEGNMSGNTGAYISNVRTQVEEVKNDYQFVDLAYYYFNASDYHIAVGSVGVNASNFESVVAEMKEEKGDSYGISWKVVTINDIVYLVSEVSWNNTDFGTVTRLDKALKNCNFETEDRLYLLTDLAEQQFGSLGSLNVGEDYSIADLRDSDYDITEYELADYGIKILEVEPQTVFFKNLSAAMLILEILAVLLTLIAIPMLLFFMRRWVLMPINRLDKAMDRIESGDLDYRLKVDREENEFRRIGESFNSMMDEVSHLKIDAYESKLEKRDIRMQYLNQQIQPHFILNALNILYSYEPEEYELSQKMILCISKYFRHIVYANDKFVTLKAEMEHIMNYFEIQKARFPELFYSIVEWEEDLDDALVPPLLFQTFVENSIKNSLKIGNRITIYVVGEHYKNEEHSCPYMRIRFADTGEGISDEILSEIDSFRKTHEPQPHLGVGIQNSIDRLEVIYDEPTSLRFSRDPNYPGTNIEIVLPVHFKGEGDIKDENSFD